MSLRCRSAGSESDTYGIEIDSEQDDALILAITACIDQMTHDVG